MAVCFNDVVNDSCCSRSLGFEVDPSYIPDVSNVWTIKGFLGLTAASIVIWYIKNFLVIWFKKYKLKFLLRTSLLSFIVISIMKLLSVFEILKIHEEFDTYCPVVGYSLMTLSWIMVVVRYHWKMPLNIKKTLYEVGFDDRRIEEARVRLRLRRNCEKNDITSMPPCYPNGWISVFQSTDLDRGEVKGRTALGYKFCVFRDEHNDTSYVLDAYCPHLGADLTAGVVCGDSIQCPFHGWCAKGKDGSCFRKIEDTNQNLPEVPDSVKAKKWISREVNGMIFIWHHAEKDKQEPYWEMPRVEEVCNGEWVFRGRTEHEVHCHIQEIPENGADINHLKQLHSTSVFLGKDWMNTKSWFNVLTHHWDPEWTRDEEVPHIARIKLNQKTTFLGFNIPFSKLEISIEQIGPATVHLHIKSWFGRAILMQNIIPEGPLTMRVIHTLYTEPCVKPFPAELLIRAEATMLERDIAVWNNKKFLKTPQLLKDEGMIRKYRRWYRQFYSENSPTLLSLRESVVDY